MTIIATVRGPNGKVKYLLDTDLVWLVKLATHEPGGSGPEYEIERDAVLWTLLNRWMGPAGDDDETISALARALSQPINVTQIGKVLLYDRRTSQLDGDPLACRGVPSWPGSEECALARAKLRWQRIAVNIARPLSEYQPSIIVQVQDWMAGKRPNCKFPGWADFAAKFATPTAGRVSVAGLQRDSNAFFKESWSRSWTVDSVTINGTRCRSVALLKAGLGLLGGILLGGLGLAALRNRGTLRLWGRRIQRRIGS